MNPNDEFKCDHLKGETLVLTKKYNDKQYVAKSFETGRSHLIGVDPFGEPHLCLAHVADSRCLLTKKEK